MKTLILAIVLMMTMMHANSQSVTNAINTNDCSTIENRDLCSNSTQTSITSQRSIEFQNRFSTLNSSQIANQNFRSGSGNTVTRAGSYVMLTGAGLIAVGGLTIALSRPSDGYGASNGDIIGALTIGAGIITFVTGGIVAIVGSVGGHSRYSFQFQSKKNGLSLAYHF